MTATTQQEHSLATDRFFESLKEYLIATTGLSYYRHREGELADHIARHMSQLAITDCLSYLQLLQSGPAGDKELDKLIEDLTIGETFFFRHTDLFTALEQSILPDIIEKNKQHRRLRIWSAGSSIGAEAYTISIILKRHLAHLIRDWEITIIGTDINRSFLSRAAKAQFEDWALRGVSEETKQQCFSHSGTSWTLRPEFKQGVSFEYHNLAKHPFPSMLHNLFAFDVILCRNVMIYFGPSVIERIIADMRQCLVDGGWLLVGHAEHNMESFRDFRTVTFDGATAYQRVEGQNSPTPVLPKQNRSRDSEISTFTSAQAIVESQSHDRDARATARSSSIMGDLRSGKWDGRETSPQPERINPQRSAGPRLEQPAERPAELVEIRAMADRGEIEAAELQCQRLLKTHKLNPTCHLYHALILEQLGDHSSCEQALRRAIYLDRNFVLAHYYLGLTLRRLGSQAADAARSLQNARQVLTTLASDRVIDDSDGLTAAELDELTRMQLDAIES